MKLCNAYLSKYRNAPVRIAMNRLFSESLFCLNRCDFPSEVPSDEFDFNDIF